jgi:hypothetical protein
MYDRFHLQSVDKFIYLCLSLKYHSVFFRLCKECTTEHLKFCSQCKECTSELYGVRKERARRAHQSDKDSRRNLKVTEYLRGGICVEKAQRDRVIEHSVRKSSARCASSKENARRARRIYFQEILRI